MMEDCVKASKKRSKVSAQALNGAHSCPSLLVTTPPQFFGVVRGKINIYGVNEEVLEYY